MIRCIIVEDEPLAVDVLVDYVSQVPALKLQTTCPDAFNAMAVITREPIDLMFLDLHLPGLKGLDFLGALAQPPKVIITTAYHDYALKGYDHNVIDYLLKPIAFPRFVQALNKVFALSMKNKSDAVLTVHSEKKTILIPTDDVLFVESQKEYVKFHTVHGTHLSKYALSKLEEKLDPDLFLRIHRSFIVAVNKITAFSSNTVEVGGKSLSVGGNYRESVINMLKKRFQNNLSTGGM